MDRHQNGNSDPDPDEDATQWRSLTRGLILCQCVYRKEKYKLNKKDCYHTVTVSNDISYMSQPTRQDKVFFLYYFCVICTGVASLFCEGACDHWECCTTTNLYLLFENVLKCQGLTQIVEMVGEFSRNSYENNITLLCYIHELSSYMKYISWGYNMFNFKLEGKTGVWIANVGRWSWTVTLDIFVLQECWLPSFSLPTPIRKLVAPFFAGANALVLLIFTFLNYIIS